MMHAIDVAVYTVEHDGENYFLADAEDSEGRTGQSVRWGDLANNPAYRLEMASYVVVVGPTSCDSVNTAGFAVVHKESGVVAYFISLGETTRLNGVTSQRDNMVNERTFRRVRDAYIRLNDGSYVPTSGVPSVEVQS